MIDRGHRLKKLRRQLSRRRLDCLLVTGKENIYYLSGFSGDDNWLLVTGDRAFLITDFRYRGRAEEELTLECELRVRSSASLSDTVAALCRELSLKRPGYEEHHLSCAQFNSLKRSLKGRKWRPAGSRVEEIRMIKDPEEISLLRESARLTGRVLNQVMSRARSGLTEKELAGHLTSAFIKRGCEAAFPPIVAGGGHSSQPHAASSGRQFGPGKILLVDLGMKRRFYNSDMTRTFVLNTFPRRFKTIYRAVMGARKKALQEIRPGVKASFVDARARDYLAEKGYGSYFGHSLGHGVGLEVHERPLISAGSGDIIEVGMVFTIEPGVYIPGWGGIRIEDMVLVTDNGCEVLTTYPKDLLSMVLNGDW